MFYHAISDKTYSTIEEFKVEHKNTSFGDLLDSEYRKSIGLHEVVPESVSHDPELETLEPGNIVLRDGQWVQTYTARPLIIHEDKRLEILIQRFERALDNHFDSIAQQRRYMNRITCIARAGYPGPFRDECIRFGVWMDSCNAQAYALLQDVLSGKSPPPATVEEFTSSLPEFSWQE